MTITLPPDQQAWLEKQVAEGRYASVVEAARAAISAAMVEAVRLEVGGLAWAQAPRRRCT